MAAIGAAPYATILSLPFPKTNVYKHRKILKATRQSTIVSVAHERSITTVSNRVKGESKVAKTSVTDYIEEAVEMVKLTKDDGGGPRWFVSVECGAPTLKDAPLLLYLPGVDGVGAGLARQISKLGKIFEVWCLHIPAMDQTPFPGLLKLVDSIVKKEYSSSPNRPIYLVGESLGACLALSVAARNPDSDLALILVNPATSFRKSAMQQLLSVLASPPIQSLLSIPLLINPMTGDYDYVRSFLYIVEERLGQSETGEDLIKAFKSLSLYYSEIAHICPSNTFIWKMEMLQNACDHANSRLHAIRAETLTLSSGRDPLLPSAVEGERLRKVLSNCDIRIFSDNGHFLLLEDGVDLVYTLKATRFYRRGRSLDYVLDFLPPTPSEFKRAVDPYCWVDSAVSSVMLSTLEDGRIVRGLEGFPSEGPTLLVGNHMLCGMDIFALIIRIFTEKNVLVRGLAHPFMFYRKREGKLPNLSFFDSYRVTGIAPVSGINMFKLLATKSHVLLYPGGVREALHRKGEEYQLFWPEQSEFVRVAARFGAKIVPFGVVGEDDIVQLVLDYDDLVRIPYLKAEIEELTDEAPILRANDGGEISNQQLYYPGFLPKVPGRFYYLFGKPIETMGKFFFYTTPSPNQTRGRWLLRHERKGSTMLKLEEAGTKG